MLILNDGVHLNTLKKYLNYMRCTNRSKDRTTGKKNGKSLQTLPKPTRKK